ncbi:hypothetical protein [Pseudomonas brenneri]
MIKFLCGLLFFVSLSIAAEGDKVCSYLGDRQAYPSVLLDGVGVCFVYVETKPEYEGQLSKDPDGISAYSGLSSGKISIVYEFLYAGTEGRIENAFVLSAGSDSENMLFVIHSIEKPRSWDPVSDIYDVSVMVVRNGNLVRDEKLSRFFDMGGDFVDAQGRPTYIYPYKDRTSVETVVRSSLFKALRYSSSVEGTVREKSFFYGGEAEPSQHDRRKNYLIKDDKVTVDDSTGGWCRVTYAAKAIPITMWMQCKAITFSEE